MKRRRPRWGLAIAIGIAILASILWLKAEQQGRIALARQLAAQARSAFLSDDVPDDTGVLLAIESMRLNPSGEASELLQADQPIQRTRRTDSDGYMSTFAFSPDGQTAAIGSEKNVLRLWSLATGEDLLTLPHDDCTINALGFSGDGRYIVSACNVAGAKRGMTRVWDVSTGEEIARMDHERFGVCAAAISSHGDTVASATFDGIVHIWDVASAEETAALVHPDLHTAYGLAFSADDSLLAVAGREDFSLHIWSLDPPRQIARLPHDGYVFAAAFSPDARYVASSTGEQPNYVRVWEVASQREISRMPHVYLVRSVAFSPDGRYLLSASEDLTSRVWDAMTGAEVSRIGDVFARGAAFSPDGASALVGDYYGTVHRWRWRPPDMIADACARMTRNLTRSEWETYIGQALPYRAVCSNLPAQPVPTRVIITSPTTYTTATPPNPTSTATATPSAQPTPPDLTLVVDKVFLHGIQGNGDYGGTVIEKNSFLELYEPEPGYVTLRFIVQLPHRLRSSLSTSDISAGTAGWRMLLQRYRTDYHYADEPAIVLDHMQVESGADFHRLVASVERDALEAAFGDTRAFAAHVVDKNGTDLWHGYFALNPDDGTYGQRPVKAGMPVGVIMGFPYSRHEREAAFSPEGDLLTVREPASGFYRLYYAFDLGRAGGVTTVDEIQELGNSLQIWLTGSAEDGTYESYVDRLLIGDLIPTAGLLLTDLPIDFLREHAADDYTYSLQFIDHRGGGRLVHEARFVFVPAAP
jgi:WD40 repeat protein